tara:strand:- start:514 stop:711 length:198 start_codon:yes stop_codon:yes gene_type:complete
MKIKVNGSFQEFAGGTVNELLREMNISPDFVAVALNRKIVHRHERDSIDLEDGDVLELVKAAPGG